MRVCIFGSCVSRDIFNCAEDNEVEIPLYAARSSIGSIYSPRPFEDVYSNLIKSAFQRRVVGMDIRKNVIQKFNTIDPDIILIDLIDERFSLMEAPSGGRFTLSVELRQVLKNSANSYREIPSGSEEFLRHWQHGWRKLIAEFDSRKLRDRVLVNKVYWQTETQQGSKFDSKLCEGTNRLLKVMYDYQEQDLAPDQFIEYGNLLSCPDDHRWGPTPFHYSKESHVFAFNFIKEYLQCRLSQREL